ncbi:MAG: carcinine hydrolase/isopenicillin-N N-acyltransferase family protein [Candidatus Thorarchaeota archaeon]
MTGGRTIGAVHVGPRLLLFKNKDLVDEGHTDHLHFNDSVFSVRGVAIGTGQEAGVSIGINRHGLTGCSATVLATYAQPYDYILEEILQSAKNVDDAYQIIEEKISSGMQYRWCNIVLGDSNDVAVVEISENECELEKTDDYVVRTNHHVLLGTSDILESAPVEERKAGRSIWTSRHRRQRTERQLGGARTVAGITEILSMHSESRGFDSICRHANGNDFGMPFLGLTVYSYVVDILYQDNRLRDAAFYVAPGNPCVNTYKKMDVDFNASQEVIENQFTEQRAKSNGLGLHLAKWIAGIYNGSIEIARSDLGGAGVDVYLRKAE